MWSSQKAKIIFKLVTNIIKDFGLAMNYIVAYVTEGAYIMMKLRRFSSITFSRVLLCWVGLRTDPAQETLEKQAKLAYILFYSVLWYNMSNNRITSYHLHSSNYMLR